jgi:hypothetical protein
LTSRARLPGSGIAVLVPLCPLLLLVVPTSRRRFRLVKASKTFCVLVAYTDLQKVSAASKEPKRCGLPCSPMAKVELYEVG